MRSSASAANKKKPEWNSFQTDLTAHKLTLDELERRRASRRSKNLDAARSELYSRLRNEQSRLRRRADVERSKLRGALQRGTQLEQREVYDLLERTDRQLALIADLIGERGKKHRGVPNVTNAPNARDNSPAGSGSGRDLAAGSGSDVDADRSWLPRQAREVESQLDLLSNSVMNVTALNDETNLTAQRPNATRKKQPTAGKQHGALKTVKTVLNGSRAVMENHVAATENSENTNPSPNASTNVQRSPAKQKSPAPTQWFVSLDPTTRKPSTSPKRDVRRSPERTRGTPRSPQRSARSSSASPSTRPRSPLKMTHAVGADARLMSARMHSGNDRSKIERIVQVWTATERSDGATTTPRSIDQLDVLCDVCITVRQLERALQSERLIRERTEAIAVEQRELIDALTGELIDTQQRIASLEHDFNELHREVATKLGPVALPVAAAKHYDYEPQSGRLNSQSRYEARKYDTTSEELRLTDRLGQTNTRAAADWLGDQPDANASSAGGPLSSGASVLKEVDRLKEQYRAIQSKLNNVLQRSAQTLRTHGNASPTRLSQDDQSNGAAGLAAADTNATQTTFGLNANDSACAETNESNV